MRETAELHDIIAARAGDQSAFARLIEPYRRELLVHCYRMLGSLEDAEDTLQETFLRVWRRLESFEGRAPFRAWCYKIATHAALDEREKRRARSLPTITHPAANPHDPLPPPHPDPLWLQPLPDTLLPAEGAGPEALYDTRESVSLAFLAALQSLPGRQRAVLILRDVLAWRAEEVAELLDTTVAAANSALQRARATMQSLPASYRTEALPPENDPRVAAMLAAFMAAWEAADMPRLVALLREDAVLTMPPLPAWFQGRAAIQAFLEGFLFLGDATGRYRMTPTRANGCPAFAIYMRGEDGVYRPGGLQVVTIGVDGIAAIHDFLVFDTKLFERFGLPGAM